VSLILDEHRQYLSDAARVDALADAIARVVRPGHVVVDLGAGTGILGLLACRAGAARVYAIEEGGMIEVAREICRANGFADRVVFVRGLSTTVDLPEKADVIVADQIGRFGFDAGLFEYFADARERFLKPDGVTIPASISLQAAAVESPADADRVAFWERRPLGFFMPAAAKIARNTGYPTRFQPPDLLSDDATLCTLDASTHVTSAIRADLSLVARRDGMLHGIGAWFTAHLADGVPMSNSPLAARRIDRSNVFFPLAAPVAIVAGDSIRVAFGILPSDLIVSWTVDVVRDGRGIAHSTQSTWNGLLLPREELTRTSLAFVPKRSARAEARLSVLELCDGHRPLGDIEREVFRRHSELFRSPDEAAVFVAEVVTRYAAS